MTTTAELKKIAEGREAEIYEWEPGTVLRLFRDARDIASLEYERDAMEAVRVAVPLVPAVFGVTEVMGRPGLIMERIDGTDLLSIIASHPWTVWRAGRTCGQVHARLHAVRAPESIPSLHERGRQRAQSPLVSPHIAEWALSELEAMPDGDRLLHGDFHPANILMPPAGPVVIDWPNVTRGDPDADLGRTLLMLRVGAVPPGSPPVIRAGARFARSLLRGAYLRAYRREREVDMAVVQRWMHLRAVDRLSENIVEEREALLAIIAKAMAKA